MRDRKDLDAVKKQGTHNTKQIAKHRVRLKGMKSTLNEIKETLGKVDEKLDSWMSKK